MLMGQKWNIYNIYLYLYLYQWLWGVHKKQHKLLHQWKVIVLLK
jgi:hypothetical protein